MSVHYAPSVRNAAVPAPPAQGVSNEQHHQDAMADTGTSHSLPGRLYLVQCEWCPEAFAAYTKAEAMRMFRAHEAAMLS